MKTPYNVRVGPERTGTPFRSFFGLPERRSGPFKTTRLVVKLHQADVLVMAFPDKAFQTKNAPNVVWRPGSARTRWGSLQRSPDPLAAFKLLVPSALDPRRPWRLVSRTAFGDRAFQFFFSFEH